MPKNIIANFIVPHDAKRVNSLVVAALASHAKSNVLLHQAAVACLVHACDGGIQPLNTLHSKLRAISPNIATALRLWIGRIQDYDLAARDKDGEVIRKVDGTAKSPVVALGFEKQAFYLINNTPVERKTISDHTEKNYANPDGETYKMFMVRDNAANLQFEFVNDAAILKALNNLVKKVNRAKAGEGNMVNHVSKIMEDALNKAKDIAESIAQAGGKAPKAKTEIIADKPKAKVKAKVKAAGIEAMAAA